LLSTIDLGCRSFCYWLYNVKNELISCYSEISMGVTSFFAVQHNKALRAKVDISLNWKRWVILWNMDSLPSRTLCRIFSLYMAITSVIYWEKHRYWSQIDFDSGTWIVTKCLILDTSFSASQVWCLFSCLTWKQYLSDRLATSWDNCIIYLEYRSSSKP
jgi:hypothetical protein